MAPDVDRKALEAPVKAALARKSLLEFARRMHPGWTDAPHLTRIAELLEAVDRGEIRRLIINLPPRHAKSTLASMLFPAWYLGRHPTRNVITVTHSQELSDRNSRAQREYVRDALWPFDAKLSEDSTSVSRWNLNKGGGNYAAGVETSVTGRGMDLCIIDDAHHDTGSDGEREAVWRWYTEILIPRLEPGGAIVAIGTRFAEDDMFGRMLAAEESAA